MRVRGQAEVRGCDCIPLYPPPPGPWHRPVCAHCPGFPQGRAAAGFRRLLHDLGTVQVSGIRYRPDKAERGQGGEGVAAAGERGPGQRHWQRLSTPADGRAQEADFPPSHPPQGQKASDAFPEASREAEGSWLPGNYSASGLSTVDSGDARKYSQAGKGGCPPWNLLLPLGPSPHSLRIRAFMSSSHGVRALSCPELVGMALLRGRDQDKDERSCDHAQDWGHLAGQGASS